MIVNRIHSIHLDEGEVPKVEVGIGMSAHKEWMDIRLDGDVLVSIFGSTRAVLKALIHAAQVAEQEHYIAEDDAKDAEVCRG
jgi:hypothetical protein